MALALQVGPWAYDPVAWKDSLARQGDVMVEWFYNSSLVKKRRSFFSLYVAECLQMIQFDIWLNYNVPDPKMFIFMRVFINQNLTAVL